MFLLMITDDVCCILVFDSFIQYKVMVPFGKRCKKSGASLDFLSETEIVLGVEGRERKTETFSQTIFLESISEKPRQSLLVLGI